MKVTAILALISLTGLSITPNNNVTANVEKSGGVAIFVYSEPSQDYDVIESGRIVMLLDCNEVINKPIKKAIKAKADGVIIHFKDSRYDLIKFK